MATSAIPTTGINGIRFRSRIEAQWAEMFTKLGWEWEYEPIDLKGYIPDFILKFPHKHILVEVKGDTDIRNIEQYADKIIKSGWEGEFLLVCSVLSEDDDCNISIGLLGSTNSEYMGYCNNDGDSPLYPSFKDDDYARLIKCVSCKKYSFYSHPRAWNCRYCGEWDKLYNKQISIKYNYKTCDGCIKYKLDIRIIEDKMSEDRYDPTNPEHITYLKRFGHRRGRLICEHNKHYSICNICCNVTNIEKGKCLCGRYIEDNEYKKIKSYWIEAKNNVQWKKS